MLLLLGLDFILKLVFVSLLFWSRGIFSYFGVLVFELLKSAENIFCFHFEMSERLLTPSFRFENSERLLTLSIFCRIFLFSLTYFLTAVNYFWFVLHHAWLFIYNISVCIHRNKMLLLRTKLLSNFYTFIIVSFLLCNFRLQKGKDGSIME